MTSCISIFKGIIMRKSYMDGTSIINEGFFDKIRKILGLSTAQEKLLKKDKKITNLIKNINKDVIQFEKHAKAMFKDLGINREIDIKKYKLKDFI